MISEQYNMISQLLEKLQQETDQKFDNVYGKFKSLENELGEISKAATRSNRDKK